MPGIEDWINNPLEIIDRLYEGATSVENHVEKVKEYFDKKIPDRNAAAQVPSLNSTPLHHLPSGCLVRFRCMVQDMYDPEYFLAAYAVRSLKTAEERLASGMFRDLAECKPQQEILFESARNITEDRQTLYCIPIPAENEWVKEAFAADCPCSAIASTSNTARRSKRALDDECLAEIGGATDRLASSPHTEMSNDDESENKRSKADLPCDSSANVSPNLNFPLPGERGPACIVKMYDKKVNVKVNDILEVIGVLSNEPAMVTFPACNGDQTTAVEDGRGPMEGVEERDACSPPPSLVPRLHCILSHPLSHTNPLLPRAEFYGKPTPETLRKLQNEAVSDREQMVAVLEQGLCGDTLAAEYLLCNLISSVYARHDVVAVGKFSVNLSRVPSDSRLPSLLNALVESLVTKSFHLPLTLANINGLQMAPHKDYSANRLVSGVLQLSSRTHLLVDETALQQGQLTPEGVRNITALSSMISWQKVEYDFQFHKQDFPSDIATVIMSEGKSILKHDCLVPLAMSVATPGELERRYKALDTYLTPALLHRLRVYLTVAQLVPYELSEQMKQVIELDFVDARREDKKNMSVDDFHSLLVIARLLSLSYGQPDLTAQTWDKAKVLEAERKLRLC